MRWNDRIGRRIKLSDLHILLAVAQAGSMAKAANQLAVSHPVVSRSISDLEHTLGVRLLERNPRGVELTAYGRAMLQRSHAAFDELRQGVKDIEFLSDPTVGEVRIGTTPPLAASFVFAVIGYEWTKQLRVSVQKSLRGGGRRG
jgi:DNA-binding transcriptional LysR family regulator